MSQSELIAARKARYTTVFKESDSFGRVIHLMRLKPSQQAHVREMCPGLSGTDSITVIDKETGKPEVRELSRNFVMILAASVRQIDDSPYTFPKTRADLDFIIDVLDEEGLAAASQALVKASLAEAGIDVPGEAKNEVKTPA